MLNIEWVFFTIHRDLDFRGIRFRYYGKRGFTDLDLVVSNGLIDDVIDLCNHSYANRDTRSMLFLDISG